MPQACTQPPFTPPETNLKKSETMSLGCSVELLAPLGGTCVTCPATYKELTHLTLQAIKKNLTTGFLVVREVKTRARKSL